MVLTTDTLVASSNDEDATEEVLEPGFEFYDHDEATDVDTDPEEHDCDDGEDYSSDVSDSEPEIVWGPVEPSGEDNTSGNDLATESLKKTFVEAPSENNVEEIEDISRLSQDKEARAVSLASTIVSAQLQEYSWIESMVPEAKIRDIVDGLRIKKQDYDYLPHVFYVVKRDFELWKDRDGSDHFFIWNKGNSEINGRNEDNEDSEVTNDNDSKGKLRSFQLYFCHCAGAPRKKKITDQDQLLERPAKKTRNVYKPTKKVGCKARLIVHDVKPNMEEFASRGERNQLRVIYYYKHTGHTLASLEDLQHLRVTEETKSRIRNLVRLGLCTRKILTRINLSGSQAFSRHQRGSLQRGHVLKYEDVYNIYYKYSTGQSQLEKNDLVSMRLWMDKLKDKGFTVFRLDYHIVIDGVNHARFAYGFMSPFQKSVYGSNFKHIGLDSTHGTKRSKHELYTIIVRNPQSLSAIPVAFLLTNDHSHVPLGKWLKHIRENIGSPEYITTDDARAEYKAIRLAFGDSVTVHLCLWHVMKAWGAKLRNVICATQDKAAKELREEAMGELRRILFDPNRTRAETLISEFELKWQDHNEGKVWNYFRERYLSEDRRRRWMKCYRMGKFYAGMDTNNYVESWHNHLKSHFLRGYTNCRGDRLVYILTHDVDEFYQMMARQTVRRYGQHLKGERDDFHQRKFLDGLEDLPQRIVHEQQVGDRTVYCVRSFSVSGGYYFVVATNETISRCNCQYFMYSQRPCRHMYLLHQVHKDNPDPPLRIIHDVLERVPDRHAMIQSFQDGLEGNVNPSMSDALLEVEDAEAEEVAEAERIADAVTESLVILKKSLHDSDSIVRSSDAARELSDIVERFCSLQRTINTSGNQKRQRQ